MTPDGLISHLASGKLWIESGVPDILDEMFVGLDDMDKLWVYGDAGYHNTKHIIGAIIRP